MKNDPEKRIAELEALLDIRTHELEMVTIEQHEAVKLLIRRDLALSRASEKLQALDTAKSEFISVAAHQLRTPLSAIKWILSMVLNKEFVNNEESMQFLEKASVSTERMITLVNDLLEVDHIQSGKDQFVFVPVAIEEVIKSLITDMQPIADNRKITIETSFISTQKVSGDTVKLRAVAQNILENALKYTPLGGKIVVTISEENGQALVVVKDNGIGIPVSYKTRIFSKFFRAPNAMRADTVGSGLGLFIAHQIVERHGGKIWFESIEGSGTTFFFTIPLIRE